jgi:hypothetical protein
MTSPNPIRKSYTDAGISHMICVARLDGTYTFAFVFAADPVIATEVATIPRDGPAFSAMSVIMQTVNEAMKL